MTSMNTFTDRHVVHGCHRNGIRLSSSIPQSVVVSLGKADFLSNLFSWGRGRHKRVPSSAVRFGSITFPHLHTLDRSQCYELARTDQREKYMLTIGRELIRGGICANEQ